MNLLHCQNSLKLSELEIESEFEQILTNMLYKENCSGWLNLVEFQCEFILKNLAEYFETIPKQAKILARLSWLDLSQTENKYVEKNVSCHACLVVTCVLLYFLLFSKYCFFSVYLPNSVECYSNRIKMSSLLLECFNLRKERKQWKLAY